MIVIALVMLAATAVPEVTAGPALAEEARAVEAPFSEIIVYSDRAKVRRRARLELGAGIHKLALPDLPGAVMVNTIRVDCQQARVLRIEAVPVTRERFSIDQVEEQIAKLETARDQLTALDGKTTVYSWELGFLDQIKPRLSVDESKRVGKATPPIWLPTFRKVLDYLDRRVAADRVALRKLQVQRRDLVEKMTGLQREVQAHNLGAFSDRKIQVLAIVSAKRAGAVTLDLEYFVPGASWLPTYNIQFDSARNRVSLETAGMVRQATGEDWTDAAVALSTAIPGQGIELPELLSWTLGEKREFIPRPRPARRPKTVTPFAAPQPQASTLEAERQARRNVLQQRIAQLQSLTSMNLNQSLATITPSLDGLVSSGQGYGAAVGSVRGRGSASMSARPRPSRKKRARPSPPPPMPVQNSPTPAYDFADAEVSGAMVTAESVSLRPGQRRTRRTSSKPLAQATSLGLFEPTYYQPPRFSDRNLPAVVAGGLDFIYRSPTRTTIPADGQWLRVPLAAETYPAKTFYEATPSLKKMAYLRAQVTNRGQRPILRGPANIFMGRDFAGQGQLATTGPGGIIELPLGADENIRILHQVTPKTVTKGLISKDEITTYTTTIEIGNYKKKAVTILIHDQIPKTRNEDIEIEKGKMSPAPEHGPDALGVMRWKLAIPAGQTKTIQFSYRIKRPENWQLSQ